VFREENTEDKDVRFFVEGIEDDETVSTRECISDKEDDLQNFEDTEELEDETSQDFQSPVQEGSVSRRTWKQGEKWKKLNLGSPRLTRNKKKLTDTDACQAYSYSCLMDPFTLSEAISSQDAEEWKKAMDEEIMSLPQNHT
jgi:hypothetical protein